MTLDMPPVQWVMPLVHWTCQAPAPGPSWGYGPTPPVRPYQVCAEVIHRSAGFRPVGGGPWAQISKALLFTTEAEAFVAYRRLTEEYTARIQAEIDRLRATLADAEADFKRGLGGEVGVK